MTKEQILKHLTESEWSDELLERLEEAVANYVVFSQDPDDYHSYGHQYHLTEAAARADYESRNFVPAGRWCYAVIKTLHTDDLYDRREVYSK